MHITAAELKSMPIFWSRLGFPYDPPMLNENGKPLVFNEDFSEYLRSHRQFLEKGVKLHTGLLHSGWVGIDTYDYSLTDRVLDSIMSLSNDILYMARIKLNPPLDWCRENPEELFLYENAPRDPEMIASLVGTLKHDILGYDSERGYYSPGTLVDTRPNVGGVIGMQSISSKKWLADASETLLRLLHHIEEKPYADRIIGFQVCFGPCGENMTWGRQSYRCGDYGIGALRSFYDFGLKKYGTESELRAAWDQLELARDNVILPTPDERYGNGEYTEISELFRDERQDRMIIDYDEFLSNSVSSALECFAKVVKDFSAEKLTGVFYGYIFEMQNAHYAGHLAIEKLLRSPYIDFFSSPFSYGHRQDGNTGGEMTAVQSINLKKQWIDETDLRTFLASDLDAKLTSGAREGTYCSLWRELCKNLSHGSGFWWMDLGGGWFDDEGILNEIGKMTGLMSAIGRKPARSVADILIVADENSYYCHKRSKRLQWFGYLDLISKFHKSGALADIYRICDLHELDLSRYKLVIFLDAYKLTENQLSNFDFGESTTFMFTYAAGICADGTPNLTNIEALTGFSVRKDKPDGILPGISLEGGKKLGKKADGRNIVFATTPELASNKINQIVREAGCHIYADGEELVVYGDSRLLFISSKNGFSGELNLGRPATDVITGERVSMLSQISLPPLGFKVYIF